jgi:hypothetical protein
VLKGGPSRCRWWGWVLAFDSALAPGLSRGPGARALIWLSWHSDEENCPACVFVLPVASGEEEAEEDAAATGTGSWCRPTSR